MGFAPPRYLFRQFRSRHAHPSNIAKGEPIMTMQELRPDTWTGRVAALLWIVLALCPFGNTYSVLTHEEIIDLEWNDQIQPMLLARFPGATDDDLRQAHSYAYGGSVVQDMGYYPFGSKYFSDLTHYVRTGDFVLALIEQSSDLNDYAFALGALAHYISDSTGHPAINHVVALSFPKLQRKYGEQVTYEDDPKAHIRTEFGFDMVQVAKNRYTSDRYHDFIGFNIAKPLLERAFEQTYGLPLQQVMRNEDLSIGTFRRAISKVIPEMTRVALLSRHKELVRDTPNFDKRKFLYHLSRADYQKEWGTGYRRPGAGTRILAFFLKMVPKVGPFKAVAFEIPTTQTEDLYIKSMDKTLDAYTELLRQQKADRLQLVNLDIDTGRPAHTGEYRLADENYARLLDDLSQQNFTGISTDLRQNILSFYGGTNAPIATRRDKKAWQKTEAELSNLKALAAATGQ